MVVCWARSGHQGGLVRPNKGVASAAPFACTGVVKRPVGAAADTAAGSQATLVAAPPPDQAAVVRFAASNFASSSRATR
jgi:hypothetical protein